MTVRDEHVVDGAGSLIAALPEVRLPDEGPSFDIRVVVVGRTGLDHKLRLDAAADLVRCAGPMEAIGELGTPHIAALSVVVLSEAQADRLTASPEAAEDFVHAVRLMDPKAKVFRIAPESGPAVVSPFDGVIRADVDASELRRLLRGGPTAGSQPRPTPKPSSSPLDIPAEEAQAPTFAPKPEASPEPKPGPRASSISSPAPPALLPVSQPATIHEPHEISDEPLVRVMIQGQNVGDAAISLLRTRLRDATLTLVPGDATPSSAGSSARVAWEGRVFGALTSARAGVDLSTPASWLAAWLRLDEQQAQLRAAALTDPLTGAWNRRYFEYFLAAAIEQARQARRSVTVLLFDIDDFKQYNDQHGHETGDEILRETVRLLRAVVRPTDAVCRIGGDEFAVVFNEPQGPRDPASRHPSSIHQLAERFRRQLREHRFPKLGGAPGMLTISGGLATYPWDGLTPTDLVRRADELALESKRQGKNVLTFGSPGE